MSGEDIILAGDVNDRRCARRSLLVIQAAARTLAAPGTMPPFFLAVVMPLVARECPMVVPDGSAHGSATNSDALRPGKPKGIM